MTVARTKIAPVVQAPIAMSDGHCIEGLVVHFSDFSITDSSDSTAACYVGGLVPWRIVNESAAAATFTFYDALTQDGTALAVQDSDAVPVPTLAVADDESSELPGALAGCTWLVIAGAAAGDHFTLVCKR